MGACQSRFVLAYGRLALSVEGVSKVYRIYPSQKARLLEALTRRRRHREVWALREVSFELRAGRSFGLVGENGAGKSTLLKILTGCAFPTSGVVRKEGKVAAILELGMGFHGEFSGRDNAGLNAALMGLAPGEVRRAVPQILVFSELGEAFDQPVSVGLTYLLKLVHLVDDKYVCQAAVGLAGMIKFFMSRAMGVSYYNGKI